MAELKWTRNIVNPTMFQDDDSGALVDTHVDDFHATGPDSVIEILFVKLQQHLLIKVSTGYGIGSSYQYLRAT